jgi:hypothetical protein
VRVEGTLSLFDWRPAPLAPAAPEPASPPLAEGSGPHPQPHPLAVAAGARIVIFDCETTGTDRVTDQVIEARIWAGIHFRHADQAAANLGRQVEAYTHEHQFDFVR